MTIARNTLLWISENRKLRQTLPKYKFIRKAVSRFMPGEKLEDALRAAEILRQQSITTVFTHLGENVTDEGDARAVAEEYVDSLEEIHKRKLETSISVKLTHLGLDLSQELCLRNLMTIVERARALGNEVWIDIEQSHYVDRTIATYKTVRHQYPKVGLCLQAYLHRTEKDLEDLLPLSSAIRLVKGAYKEPASIAFKRKSDVDANFFRLAMRMLENSKQGASLAIATHDMQLIRRLIGEAQRLGLSKGDYEIQMLYGIQTGEQLRLAADGYRMRILISYGLYWFPWYVRRLAERPANVFFVLKKLFA
ncbi:MAG: proline dehydrogenase [Ignavibacteria bacterium]|nr:proline dehydrogenase [Ignavibacteria bacterium]